MEWAAKRTVLEKHGDDIRKAVENVKEVKMEISAAVEKFETKVSTITKKIVEAQNQTEKYLKDGNTLLSELMNFHKEEAFAELSNEVFVSDWITPRINIRDYIHKEVEKLENEEKALITELENESENVLELINTKLESQLQLLNRTITTLNNFVVNASLLGPNVKNTIEKLMSKIKTENESELQEKFATKELKQKVTNYKGFLLSQKDKILLEAQGSVEDTITFKKEILKKIRDEIRKSTDPELEQKKKEFKTTLRKITRQLKLIEKLVKEVKDNDEDFDF